MRVFSIVLILLSFASCKKGNTHLSKQEVKSIMLDMAEVEVFVNNYIARDTTKNKETELQKYCDSVLAIHKTTGKQFKASLDYYIAQPDEFRVMLDSLQVIARKPKVSTIPNKKSLKTE